jgi:excisionase family DNA binding protein
VSAIVDALLAELDDAALAELASRLAPFLPPFLSARVDAGDDPWLTTREAAAHLGLSVPAVHRLLARNAIPFSQAAPGARCWFRRSELDAWRADVGAD